MVRDDALRRELGCGVKVVIVPIWFNTSEFGNNKLYFFKHLSADVWSEIAKYSRLVLLWDN